MNSKVWRIAFGTCLAAAVAFVSVSFYVALAGNNVDTVDLGVVQGRIFQNDQPQSNMWISFQPLAGGRPSFARSDRGGHYALRYVEQLGALLGTHRVKVGSGGESDDFGNLITPPVELLSCEVEVRPDENTFDFHLPASPPTE